MIALGTAVLCTYAVLAQAQWSVSAGRETFTFRDVARSGPPAEASPVEWTGSGPSLVVTHDRTSARRAHRFNLDVASAGAFAYAGPVRRADAHANDRAFRLEGRYEYRRFIFRDRLVRGLEPGVGVQVMGRRLSLNRHIGADTLEMTATGTAAAIVAAATFQRWPRWSAAVTWTNGIAFLREHDVHSADRLSDVYLWGGGWLTDLSLSGTVRIASRAWVTASYLTTGEGTAISHHNYAFGRQRFAMGVTYGG